MGKERVTTTINKIKIVRWKYLQKILTMPPHGRRANSTVPSPCGHDRERAKPYSVGQRPYSVVHHSAHGFQRGRATLPAARKRGRQCGGIVRILRRLSEPPGGHRWPPEGGSASMEAMGGEVHDRIGALPDGKVLWPLATVPARAGHGGTGGLTAGCTTE